MGLLSLEHGRTAYWADFAWHGAVALGLAATLGAGTPALVLVLGYLAYGLAHHAAHHGGWHGLHHHAAAAAGCGVSTGLWNHVFVTVPTTAPRAPTTGASPVPRPWAALPHPDNHRKPA